MSINQCKAALHVANVNIECEIEQEVATPYPNSLNTHPNFLQLQFLPLLYADPDDQILVSHRSEPYFPQCQLFPKTCEDRPLDVWGHSPTLERWSKTYKSLPLDLLRQLHSKAFSYSLSPKLPGSTLLHTKDELLRWLTPPLPKVLKTCYGFSGRGHLVMNHTDILTPLAFCKKQWQQGLPVIAEPWVDRVLDFSTQWDLRDEPIHLGTCIMQNSGRGSFSIIEVGSIFPFPDDLREHIHIAKPILSHLIALGFRGNLGIDAMIYIRNGKHMLHPIVEINPRKTFGYVALRLHEKHRKRLTLSYGKSEKNLLPNAIIDQHGNLKRFPLQLSICLY